MGDTTVGILGAGGMGREHAQAWRRIGVPVRVFARTAPARDELAADTGAEPASSLDELLSAVDIVDVCTPTDTHTELVKAAAAAGKHVICEKPLARTLAEAIELVEFCAQAGVQLHVAHVVRYFPEYAAMKATFDAGELGAPAVLRLSRSVGWPEGDSWFTDEARSGGLLVDLMIHDYDFARWMAGEVRRVYARRVTRTGGGYARAYAILTHDSGAITHVQGEWSLPGAPLQSAIEIAGDGGLVRYDSAAGSFRLQSAKPGQQLPMQPYAEELGEFLAAIRGGPPPRVGTADALAALRVALAAEESSRTGAAVEVSA